MPAVGLEIRSQWFSTVVTCDLLRNPKLSHHSKCWHFLHLGVVAACGVKGCECGRRLIEENTKTENYFHYYRLLHMCSTHVVPKVKISPLEAIYTFTKPYNFFLKGANDCWNAQVSVVIWTNYSIVRDWLCWWNLETTLLLFVDAINIVSCFGALVGWWVCSFFSL